MEYIFHIVIMLNIYIMLVLSANLTIGLANLLTMCQAAFYGIGAYIGTFFLMQFHVPLVVIIAVVALVTGAFSLLVSYASVKLKGDFFVLATMGFQLIVYTIEKIERLFPGVRETQLDIFNLQEHATSKPFYQTSPGGGNKPLR